MAWCNLDRATVLVTVSVLPESLERLNLSGCRFATLTDAGKRQKLVDAIRLLTRGVLFFRSTNYLSPMSKSKGIRP